MIEVLGMYRDGLTQEEIARKKGITQSRVSFLLKRLKELNPELKERLRRYDKRMEYGRHNLEL